MHTHTHNLQKHYIRIKLYKEQYISIYIYVSHLVYSNNRQGLFLFFSSLCCHWNNNNQSYWSGV